MCEKHTPSRPLRPETTSSETMVQCRRRPLLQRQRQPQPPAARLGLRQGWRRASAPPPLRNLWLSRCVFRLLPSLGLQRPPPLLLLFCPFLPCCPPSAFPATQRRSNSSTPKFHQRLPSLLLCRLSSRHMSCIDTLAVQFRSSRSNRHLQHENVPRNRGGVGGPIDHDPTEGLPVKKWQLSDVTVKQVEKDDDGDEAKTGSVNPDYPWPELPLPKDFYQLPLHSQVRDTPLSSSTSPIVLSSESQPGSHLWASS